MKTVEKLPSTIGPFRILRQLGEGGMGTVYEGVNETIQRHVAIKVLRSEYAREADAMKRFINEARAVNLIQHPGLVQVTDYGSLPDGAGYIVMEYLKGVTLAHRLEACGGKLSVSEGVQIAWQLADTLVAAHAVKIVHRDLKPSNVMLVSDSHIPSGERAKVLDFGLAKLTAVREATLVKTASDAVVGTPLYMSPEQCQGAGRVDTKSDVYSLGCMIYEMLTGRPPFLGDGPGEVLGKHQFHQPESLRSRVPSLPTELTALVDKLLAKSPVARPTMREVQRELEKIAGKLPPLERRTEGVDALGSTGGTGAMEHASTLSRAVTQRPPRTHRPIFYFVVIGVGLGIAAGTVHLWPARRPLSNNSASLPTPSSSQPVPLPASSSVRRITLRVLSQPADALVINAADGSVLGATPWQQEVPASPEPLQIRIRLEGYAAHQVLLPRQRDYILDVRLVPLRIPPLQPTRRRLRHERGDVSASPAASPDATVPNSDSKAPRKSNVTAGSPGIVIID